ncbi:MAG: MtrB/PioB family outer membrane beta-barrel protein [Desulfuromonadales bacterium]|nr:MtrB/PioB family outer membrane beta-barrel protein [Desulfuromonadales bacterium]
MKQRHLWLVALLSILTLMTTTTLAIASEAVTSGHVEVGISGMNTDDSPARVNEYVKTSNDDNNTVNPAINLGVDFFDAGISVGVEADVKGSDNYDFSLGADINRVFRINLDYQAFEHWKDHETLDQMGATGRDDTGGSQPSVTTDKIMAELAELATPITVVGGGSLDYDPRVAYEQELANEYIVTRRELESEVELMVPALPNVTFHAGLRIETRQGMEQAIGVQKCDSCHVSAKGKNIDERTEDFTFGATGKFGIVTVDYDYLNRTFAENSAAPVFSFEDAGNGTAYNLLYENGDFDFARTPDSEKDTHSLKARVDLPKSTSVTASYVNSEIESSKSETQGEYTLLDGDTLKTEYESFGANIATRFGKNISLSLHGNMSEIDAKHNEIYFAARDDGGSAEAAFPGDDTDAWHSAEARETSEIGVDLVYRLAKATSLRLGYEYELVDRAEEELGETKTHTLKAALKTRINNSLSGRFSYQYQDIEEPLAGAHVGIAQGAVLADGTTAIQDGDSGLWYFTTADFALPSEKLWYWSDVYPNRTLESTNQPESVHEAKVNTTWTANANMAATLFARVRFEENDRVDYEQTTYVPGISFWYAPNSKMNLTMAYTFNKQETENRMCVGWYHG